MVVPAARSAAEIVLTSTKFSLAPVNWFQLGQALDLVRVFQLSILLFDATQLAANLVEMLSNLDPAQDSLA